MKSLREPMSTRTLTELVLGGLLLSTGIVVTWLTYDMADKTDGNYVVMVGPILSGIILIARGAFHIGDYKSFVAWRYLLVNPQRVVPLVRRIIEISLLVRIALWWPLGVGFDKPTIDHPLSIVALVPIAVAVVTIVVGVLRYSKPALFVFGIGTLIGIASLVVQLLVQHDKMPFDSDPDLTTQILQIVNITMLAGFALAGIAAFFGALRAFFTFFTTVPIGGVWIGTAALVCVLSVMSGFESDLRQKILGSNAHMQITKEDGDFTDWRAVKKKLDALPGVVASTPYAVSEVVIAANNNGMNVIIKGIEPNTVGLVTDLVNDIEPIGNPTEQREVMKRLRPLVDDPHDLTVPQTPKNPKALDPAPDDMPSAGDPIDFSGGGSAATPTGPDLEPPIVPIPPILPSAPTSPRSTKKAPIVDPPPADLVTSEAPPVDYSAPGAHVPMQVVDLDSPSLSRRTQSLPGILVGRELVKQTHLFNGEEVRVVSPLSDPSNPDATGTPIPFNRDYRVAGVFYTGMYEYDLKYVYVTLDSLQEFLDRGDAIDGIEVRIASPDDTDAYIKTINELLGPSYRVQDWKDLNRSLFSALKLEKIAMFLVLGIVILVASFSIVGNLIMVVVEKAREIACLKTLGASDASVMQLFAIQGLLIGLIGTLLGVATGLVGCWAGKRFGLPLNPDVYYIDRLPIHVEAGSVLAAAAAGIVISIAATFYPALLAARVRPAAGMRH